VKSYDVAVIGGGPGGYVAAIRCAQLGMTTACIDQWLDKDGKPSLGGTCLNVGCIPSKALLESSALYADLAKRMAQHGIGVEGVSLDLSALLRRKDHVVKALTTGVVGLLRKNKVDWLPGHGRLLKENWVELTGVDGNIRTVRASHIIIATGSKPAELLVAPFDGERIVDSTGALAFEAVPERLGIIGAGVIGLELGSVWQRLGAKVVLLEALDTLLPNVDAEITREAARLFKRQGLDIRLGAQVTSAHVDDDQVTVQFQEGSEPQSLTVDRLVVAVGRRPNTEGLGADEVGLAMDERGFIRVDEACRTNLPDIYAIGDVVRGPMLAHKASEEGVAVAERIAGQQPHVNYGAIPWVIYTAPEIAWVGESQQALESAGRKVRVGVFPLRASGRARAQGDTTGLIKVIADAVTDRLLGVHLLAAHASELIAEAVLGMEYAASSEDIARTIHAHPTLSEALHEAALAVDGRALHI
jgi:dihydrolipoamide dehydrogenase